MKLTDPAEYVACAEAWIEYPVKNFTKREVNAMLGDCINHMQPDRAFEKFYPQLQSIVHKIIAHMKSFTELFSMNKFMPFIDMFQNEKVKLDVCKSILEAFAANQVETTDDPVVVHTMMYISKVVHDAVSAMTFEDELKQITQLVLAFLSKISFGRDFEATLNFLVEARSVFGNLDPVLVHLVHRANGVAMETHNIVKAQHSRKTADFVRTCVAYAFITIPSIMDVKDRLRLYLESGQIAVVNQALTQGDAIFKTAIGLLGEVNRDEEGSIDFMVDYLRSFMSTLLMVPDNPEQEPLYLLKGVLNVASTMPWPADSDASTDLFIDAISLLSSYGQQKYLYTCPKVEANDKLYGNSPKFCAELHVIISSLIERVLANLKSLNGEQARQWPLTLKLLERIVVLANLTPVKLNSLAVNLWKLAVSAGASTTKQKSLKSLMTNLSDDGFNPHPGVAEVLAKIR